LIVQCEHCQTKYRIADDKVKGKGVKVRCAKCENVFTVAPSESDTQAATPAPPSSVPQGEPPLSEGDGPAPPLPPSTDEAVPGHTDEPPGLPPLPPLDGPQDPPFAEKGPQPDDTMPPLDQATDSFELPSLGDESADPAAHRPAHEMDQTGLTSPPPSTADQPEDGGFEIEATVRDEDQPGSDPFGNEAGEGAAAVPQEQDADGHWGNIAIGGPAAPDEAGDDFGLAGSSAYEPPPPVPLDEPMEQSLPGHTDGTGSGTATVPAYKPETKTSGGRKKGVVILLLLAALGAGGYFAYPKIMEIVQSRGEQTEGILTPANVQVKALTRTDGRIVYTVRGEVKNESAGNVGLIQVEAQFRNVSGDVLSKATSYCGNLFDDRDLVSIDLKQVRSDLQNELGQSLSNANIAPGQVVPFLVILDNPPSGVSKVTVTILSFKETT
jgi:predicted Zn finger-like uncharacterized protein